MWDRDENTTCKLVWVHGVNMYMLLTNRNAWNWQKPATEHVMKAVTILKCGSQILHFSAARFKMMTASACIPAFCRVLRHS